MYAHAKQNYDSENFSRGNANYAHFATLQENKLMSTILFVSVIRDLRTEFSSRFSDIRSPEMVLDCLVLHLIYRSTLHQKISNEVN